MIPLMFALVFLTWFPFFFCKFPLSPTKSKTNDTLFSTNVSIFVQKVGLTYTGLDKCIDSLT